MRKHGGYTKTTIATRFPRHLLLASERGYSAIPGAMAVNINSWTDFVTAISQLKSDKAKATYENIILDTVDILWSYCEKYICQREQKAKISDIPFGGGYAMVEKEFDERLRSIVQMDYGLVMISHAEEKTAKDELGEETTKIGPTLPRRGAKIINRLCDILGFVKSIAKVDPTTGVEHSESWLFMRGTPRYTAGSRFARTPDAIPLTYDALVQAVHDAVEAEAAEHGGQYVKDTGSSLYTESVSDKPFDEVMDEFNKVSQELLDKGIPPVNIVKVVDSILGQGRLVKDCTEEQKSLVELITSQLNIMLDGMNE